MLLFLKQLILKVYPPCLHASQPFTMLDIELDPENAEIVSSPYVILKKLLLVCYFIMSLLFIYLLLLKSVSLSGIPVVLKHF